MEVIPPQSPGSLRRVMTALKTIIYSWDLKSDQMDWSANVRELLPAFDPTRLASGALYSNYIREDLRMVRHRAVFSGEMTSEVGRFYTCRYFLIGDDAADGEGQWVQDEGRWFGDENGKPQICYGTIRIIEDDVDQRGNLIIDKRRDILTGLAGKSEIVATLKDSLETAMRDRTSMGLIFASIENLKLINEVYGPEVGDEIIRTTGERLSNKLRSSDVIGRYGGNKFAIVLNNCSEDELPVAASRYYQSTAEETVSTGNGAISAFVTFGGVVAPKHAKTVDETVNAARAALESAITAGRRGFVAYQPSPRMENQRRENLATSDLLMRCLHDKKLDLVFQPIVLADTRQTAYYEALVRLTGEEGVLEAAGDVIALAERLDLVRLLDQQVLELVEQEIIKYPTAKMAMNVSAKTLIDPIWQSQLASFLQNNRGVCERVTLELTESAILNNLDEAIEFMKMLKDQGCSIAIDDFGSGHTSFAKLKKLPVDLVKIDGAFIRQMRDEPDDDIFPRVLCDLAKSLGLKTVAEWVETEEQAERLAELGIDYFQGTLFGEGTQQPQWRQIQGSAA